MELTKEVVLDRLRAINDLRSGRNLVALGWVKNLAVCEGYVRIDLADVFETDEKKQIKAEIERSLQPFAADMKQLLVGFMPADSGPGRTALPPQAASKPAAAAPQKPAAAQAPAGGSPLPKVRHIVAVGAGKGGVGKSTVSVNLAVGLARKGLRVGLLDGDIYGPSVPTLLGLHDQQIRGTSENLAAFECHGIRSMTMGKLVDADKPLIWRGPMAHGAFRQLALQTDWGDLDYLIIDLPPGTGDVPLTLAQMLPLTGAVIVCTPQKVAQDDARRAVGMFRQLQVPVLGVVENMSYFIGDDGKEYDLFGKGGAKNMAEHMHLPLLGMVPIHMELRKNSDAGNPVANFTGHSSLARSLESMVNAIAQQVEASAAQPAGPTLTIR